MVPYFIQFAGVCASECHGVSVWRRFDGFFEFTQRVALMAGRQDASLGEERVRVERAEQGCRVDEVIQHGQVGVLLGTVAIWVEGRNACAVFVPFVRPEVLGLVVEREPVRVHEIKEVIVRGVRVVEQGRD